MLTRLEKYNQATDKFIKALKYKNDYDQAYYGLGYVFEQLGKYKEAEELFKQAVLHDRDKAHTHYRNWGGMLARLEAHEDAIKQYQKAIHENKEYADAYNDWGISLINLKKYNEAKGKLHHLLEQIDRNHTFARHNLAFVYARQGDYGKARAEWKKALEQYQQDAKKEDHSKVLQAAAYMHAGQISHLILHEFDQAEIFYEAGLELMPDHTGILSGLVELYLDKSEDLAALEDETGLSAILKKMATNLSGRTIGLLKGNLDSDSVEPLTESAYYWLALEEFTKAENHLQGKPKKGEESSNLADLGHLYLLLEKYDEAEECLLKALQNLKQIGERVNVYEKLGLVAFRTKEFAKAASHFQQGLKLDWDNLNLRDRLARTYLKMEQLDEAEYEYKRVIKMAPYNIDALIGIGDVLTEMADKAKQGKYKADPEEMYKQALDYYDEAVQIADGASSSLKNKASRFLKRRELGALYYARGYARVSLYEAQSRRNGYLLDSAKNDFREIHATDPNYHKARRAIKSIDERRSPISLRNWSENVAPLLIIAFSLVVFVIGQLFFFRGRSVTEYEETYVINQEVLDILKGMELSEKERHRLTAMKDVEFRDAEPFLQTIQAFAGDEFNALDALFVRFAATDVQTSSFQPIEPSVYSFLSFGALLFIIVGTYLHQITRLKFAGIEIEKSSIEQSAITETLGISR